MTNIKKEIKKARPLTIASKYFGINLTKEVEGLYNENFKILKKEIEENTGTPWCVLGDIHFFVKKKNKLARN